MRSFCKGHSQEDKKEASSVFFFPNEFSIFDWKLHVFCILDVN